MDFHRPSSIYNKEVNINDEDLVKEFYTLNDQEEFNINGNSRRHNDDDKVYAKKIQKKDGSFKHMIKTAANGKLYNPVSIYGEEKSNDFLDRICKSNQKFRTVNQKAFQLYLSFLSSQNLGYFYNAEREVD